MVNYLNIFLDEFDKEETYKYSDFDIDNDYSDDYEDKYWISTKIYCSKKKLTR